MSDEPVYFGQPDLFDPNPYTEDPPPTPEKLSADRKRTIRNRAMLDRGMHPTTKVALANNNRTCASCKHCVPHTRNRTWWKCKLVPPTHGPSSDTRQSWPACIKYEVAPK